MRLEETENETTRIYRRKLSSRGCDAIPIRGAPGTELSRDRGRPAAIALGKGTVAWWWRCPPGCFPTGNPVAALLLLEHSPAGSFVVTARLLSP